MLHVILLTDFRDLLEIGNYLLGLFVQGTDVPPGHGSGTELLQVVKHDGLRHIL